MPNGLHFLLIISYKLYFSLASFLYIPNPYPENGLGMTSRVFAGRGVHKRRPKPRWESQGTTTEQDPQKDEVR